MNRKLLLIRLDAGDKFGLGHLARCCSIINEFQSTNIEIILLIKTDNQEKATEFLSGQNGFSEIDSFHFLDRNISMFDDTQTIISFFEKRNGFLILDHYSIDDDYQKRLRQNRIKWLQFDSHARINIWADILLHGSPAATKERYQKLIQNSQTELLLGTKYSIVGENFRNKRDPNLVRKRLDTIFVCFGGGQDCGATLQVLQMIDSQKQNFPSVKYIVVVSSVNTQLIEIKRMADANRQIELYVSSDNVDELMLRSDLAIISPGTISYEAACMGLPMILIPIADNQMMNAEGWPKTGCAISLDVLDEIAPETLNSAIEEIKNNSERLIQMSSAALNAVDGLGATRVKNKLMSRL